MTQYITKDGLEKLKNELDNLKSNKRKAVIERIQSAREMGDLSENAEYADARDEQSFVEGRIAELENLTKRAEIIENRDNNDKVIIGSVVTLFCDGEKRQYKIVGSNEANPIQGLISNESPIGRAFIGKRIGDKVEVDIPMGKMICEITEIV